MSDVRNGSEISFISIDPLLMTTDFDLLYSSVYEEKKQGIAIEKDWINSCRHCDDR